MAGMAGDTALHLATGYPQVIKLLLDKGVNVDTRGRGNFTAFMLAASSGELETAKILLWAGADKNALADSTGRKMDPGGTALDQMLTLWAMLSVTAVVAENNLTTSRRLELLQRQDKTASEKLLGLEQFDKEVGISYRKSYGKYMAMLKFLLENNVGVVRSETELKEILQPIVQSMPPSVLPEFIEIFRNAAAGSGRG